MSAASTRDRVDARLREPLRIPQLRRDLRRRRRARREQPHARHRREVADHRRHRHRLEQRLPDLGLGEPLGRDALARDPPLADPAPRPRARRSIDVELGHRDDQLARGILESAAGRQLALDRPREQSIVGRRRRARVREAEQVTVRPAVAGLVLGELEREVLGRLGVEPRRRPPCACRGPIPRSPARTPRSASGGCRCGRPSAARHTPRGAWPRRRASRPSRGKRSPDRSWAHVPSQR